MTELEELHIPVEGDTKITKKKLTIYIESQSLSIHDWLVILKKMRHFLVIELQDYENKKTVGYKFEDIPK